MSKPVDKKGNFRVDSLSPEAMERVALAMDCIGWLTLHGYRITFHPNGLSVSPDEVPDFILAMLEASASALEYLFPNHDAEVGRVLGGMSNGNRCEG